MCFQNPNMSVPLLIVPPTFYLQIFEAIMAGTTAALAWPGLDLRFVQNSRLWMLRAEDRLRLETLHSPDWSQWGLCDANLEIVEHFKQSILLPSSPVPRLALISALSCNLLTDKMGHSIVLALALV